MFKYKKKVLKNGLRILVIPMKKNPTTTVLVLAEAGSHYEEKEINGISHFLEHLCFKGTTRRPSIKAISQELDGLGAQSNAFTSNELTGYYAKSRAKNFHKILDVISDMYLNPTFPEVEIEKEKGVIIEEINLCNDQPMRKVYEIWDELLYGNQPAGRSILGPKENIKKMSRSDFVEYRKKHYVAEGTTVVVAGDVDIGEAIKAVEEKFLDISEAKKIKKGKVSDIQKSQQILIKYKKSDQSHFILGFRSFNIHNKNNIVLGLLAGVLGKGMSSRLFQKLRDEMGVCYYVRSSNSPQTDIGTFEISSGVTNKRVVEVVGVILEELRKISKELVSEKELNKTKEYIIGNMQMGLESSDSVAEFYGIQEILRKEIKKPSEIIKEIKKVTAEDLRKIAKQIFRNKNMNLAMIGPMRDKKSLEKIFKL